MLSLPSTRVTSVTIGGGAKVDGVLAQPASVRVSNKSRIIGLSLGVQAYPAISDWGHFRRFSLRICKLDRFAHQQIALHLNERQLRHRAVVHKPL